MSDSKTMWSSSSTVKASWSTKGTWCSTRNRVRRATGMGVEMEGQRQVADVVDGEKGPVPDDEGLHVLFEGHPALELFRALREVVELLELGPAPGFVHDRPSPCPPPRGERESERDQGPLKAPSAAMAASAFS